jgi:AcrR family transcriptional regulator
MSPERMRNRRGEGTRLREEILGAATALLDETNDPASLTLRGIARRAGISAPPIYAHFDDLPSLVAAVLKRSFDELTIVLNQAVATQPTDDPARALVAAGSAYVQFGWEHKARYQLMFSAEGYAANSIEAFSVVESLIRDCAETGSGRSTDPRLDAWMLWAGLHGVATLDKPARAELRRLGNLDRPAMLETMIRRLARIDTADKQ